jgi:putative redox protein
MDVASIMLKKRQDITAFEVNVEAERATEHPRVLTSAVIRYDITGHDIGEKALRRSIGLSATTYCPVQSMLSKTMPLKLTYRIFEGSSADERALVTSGEWTPE